MTTFYLRHPLAPPLGIGLYSSTLMSARCAGAGHILENPGNDLILGCRIYLCLLSKSLFVMQEDGSGIRQLGLQAQGSRQCGQVTQA